MLAEHGLSILIELGGRRVLFDTGAGKALPNNLEVLGIGLSTVDAIVLSHGHFDHTGGLNCALAGAKSAAVYVHPAAFGRKFSRSMGGFHEITLPHYDEREISRTNKLVLVEGPTQICPGLHLTGPVPRVTDFEDTGGKFFTDEACTARDELPDDQAAFIDTPAGTVVILGCAHAGIINTLRYIQQLTDGRPIHTVIGGTHLVNANATRMDRTVDELRRLDIRRLMPCHCTGFAAMARLFSEFPATFAPCKVGTVISF